MSKKGFSLVEVLIVIAVAAILLALLFNVWQGVQSEESLNANTNRVVRTVERARSQTLASEKDTQYGVHFNEKEVVIFEGDTFSAGASENEAISLTSKISLQNINLSNGTSSLYFKRITGLPSATGTVAVVRAGKKPATTTITIFGSGVISVE